MISEQEVRQVRAQAVQAAATCAVTVGMSDPSGVVRVAEMFETYIQQGPEAAQKLIASWGVPADPAASPQEHAAQSDSPTDVCAQELANEAYLVSSREDVQALIRQAEDGGVAGDNVTVDGNTGPLLGYLEHLLAAFPPKQVAGKVDLASDLGLRG
jgi:hypothetical protein